MAKTKKPMVLLNTSSLTPTQKNLYNSPLFQLSKGSKELFHSNFLYWLSIVDWGVFVFVMRQLAGPSSGQKFWWEANHSPSKNNIKVMREHNHFDLSIYILDGKKWRPVLVLENKVKSFPDYGQLAGYEQKALNEWKPQNGAGKVTFILLSLVNPTQYHTPGGGLPGKGKWIHRSYKDLANILKHVCLAAQYHQLILNDYIKFIEAIDQLAQTDFVLNPSDKYIGKMFRGKNAFAGDIVDDLRLDDLRQKLLYAQLMHLVADKLKSKGLKPEINPPSSQSWNIDLVCSSSFTRDSGIMDVYVKYKGHQLGVQVQEDDYRHVFVHCDAKANINYAINHHQRNQKDYEFFFEFDPKVTNTQKFPAILSPVIFNKINKMGNPPFRFTVFRPHRVNQAVHIKPNVSVDELANAIVDDVLKIIARLP